MASHVTVNPVALRKAKIVCNFGLSECKRVKALSAMTLYKINKALLVYCRDMTMYNINKALAAMKLYNIHNKKASYVVL